MEYKHEEYDKFIQSIIEKRGQWTDPGDGIWENHHIIPRCLGGLPLKCCNNTVHDNLIWLSLKEHYRAHEILAEENPLNYSIQQAWFILERYGDNVLTAEDYEHIRLERLRIFNTEEFKKQASINSKGRKWYNNGDVSIFVYNAPDGFVEGRCDADKKSIGIKSIGRKANKGQHWYNNGIDQGMFYNCPDGWVSGPLPMSDAAKLAHSLAAKGNNKYSHKLNRGFETLKEFSKRVNYSEFANDFIVNKLSDDDLAIKYNCTKRMIEKYRRDNCLFKSLWKEI